MAWVSTEERVVYQAIANTDTVQNHPLGTIIRAKDPTFGSGEFIYLKGVANTVAGLLVWYDPVNGTTTLTPNTANMNRPVAVAMSANVASQYGWYQLGGAATILKTAVAIAPDSAVWQSGTAGRIFATSTSGKQIVNARTVNAATIASGTSTIVVLVNRPHMQGQVI